MQWPKFVSQFWAVNLLTVHIAGRWRLSGGSLALLSPLRLPPRHWMRAWRCSSCKVFPQKDQQIAHKNLVELLNGHIKLDEPVEVKRSLYNAKNLYLSRCYSCGGIAVWLERKLVFPQKNEFEVLTNEDMPVDARVDFEEAAAIVDASPRGAAALLRLSIQKVCMFLGEKGNNLNADIGNLVKKGLSDKIQKALDSVRMIGNNTIHPGEIDISDDRPTAVTLFKLVNIIVDAMISQPKQIDEVYSQLPPGRALQFKSVMENLERVTVHLSHQCT